MALGRILGRSVMALAIAGAGGFAATNPGAVKAFYQDIYPSDPAKRQALDLCFTENHKFNRLDAGEREACYRRMLMPLGEVTATSGEEPHVNLIDLRRAAGEGNLPKNDIRRLEQNQAAQHSPH